MEIPVIIEPLPDQKGFTAHLGPPFDLTAEAPTAEEAQQRVTALLQRRLQQGVELRTIHVPVKTYSTPEPGWLPDDEITRDWLQQIQQYRSEVDAADRERILKNEDSPI